MKKGDTVYISSANGVEEGVVTVAKSWPNVRVDGEVRLRVDPDTLHATRWEAETASLGALASAAKLTARSRADDTKRAQSSVDEARFALTRAEANLAAKQVFEAEAVEKHQSTLNALAAREFGEGVTLRALGDGPPPEGAELAVLSRRRLCMCIVPAPNPYCDTYIVVRP